MRYIGCKKKLLPFIKNVIDDNVKNADTFCDIFSGSSTVARYFKKYYKIISNDIMYFSFLLQTATIKLNKIPEFKSLKNIDSNPIQYFNNLNINELATENSFFENNYSPVGNRMYFTTENAKRIDYIRQKIEEWYIEKLINYDEYFYLLGCFIEGIPFVSNISGTYGAYNKKWDKRAYKTFSLFPLEIFDNKKENTCYNLHANDLINKICGDILYIDPPYNTRQYSSNYHLLETAALYDYPIIKGITGVRADNVITSKYCHRKTATEELLDLIKKADFKHILISYNSEGIIPADEIEKILKTFCKPSSYKLYEIPYRRFKSNTNIKLNEVKELIYYAEK